MAAPPIPVAKGEETLSLLPGMANRHGLVAGATGTGKTVTLRVLAERLSRIGVPVFMADVKGDLSGLAVAAEPDEKMLERVRKLGVALEPAGAPVVFWDVFGEQGHPLRATISEMGPVLLGRMLDLNEVQEGVLALAFKIADDEGLLLLDLKDLRALLEHVASRASELQRSHGNVSPASVGAIQRQLLALEQQGGDRFFGEPALDLADLLEQDGRGEGLVHVLAADRLLQSPRLYSTFLLWLLSELYERLPEVGDPEKPRLVFFFDEAHLLFRDAPRALLERVEQVVRLVRSKGVGVWFVTQNPLDVPDAVLGQLGNRVQHALRAFTPRDQKAVRTAAETFRQNPTVDAATAITELGVGEALVSFLDGKGTPVPVERAFVLPPRSRLAPLSPEERKRVMRASPVKGKYDDAVDRESAYERLRARAEEGARAAQAPRSASGRARSAEPRSEIADTLGAMAKSVARSAGTQIGRELVRGILGGLFGSSHRR
ncbi:MAG TPA: helicase HerA-like domain-containing protein [Anaeromyxobacteraceae bacterium]|nr:helicase HerA-like domain-containing protein [Anaeromyxobacteraceae bacterium]